jgi:hypothetical protein
VALGTLGSRAQNGLRAQHVPRSREVLEPLGFKTLPIFLVGVTIAVWFPYVVVAWHAPLSTNDAGNGTVTCDSGAVCELTNNDGLEIADTGVGSDSPDDSTDPNAGRTQTPE